MRAALICTVVLFSIGAYADDPRVYKIEARGGGTGQGHVLSGFAVAAPVRGIVTSLHGVAGAEHIAALNRSTKAYGGLSILKVDIPHDLALIGSGEIDRENRWASFGRGPVPAAETEVVIWGHPFGIIQTDTKARVRTPPLPLLRDILPITAKPPFLKRHSPDADGAVLFLQGPLVQGLSGAPVVVADKVVAVGDGGLGQGATQLVWAIPLDEHIAWSAPSSDLTAFATDIGLFSDLADIPPELPFDETQSDGPAKLGDGHFVTTHVAVTEDGDVTYTTDTRNENSLNGFCIKAYVVLFDENGAKVATVGQGQKWCVGSVSGARLHVDSSPTRSDTYHEHVPAETTARIRRVAVIHEPGSKDVVGEILNNTEALRTVWSSAKVVPKTSHKVLVKRDLAVKAEGCERRAEPFTIPVSGSIDVSKGWSTAPGFELDVRGNNGHGVTDLRIVNGQTVSFTAWAQGPGAGVPGLCIGAEGANVSVDVYAWIFDPPAPDR